MCNVGKIVNTDVVEYLIHRELRKNSRCKMSMEGKIISNSIWYMRRVDFIDDLYKKIQSTKKHGKEDKIV